MRKSYASLLKREALNWLPQYIQKFAGRSRPL